MISRKKTPSSYGDALGPRIVLTHSYRLSPLGPAVQLHGGSKLISASSFWIRFADEESPLPGAAPPDMATPLVVVFPAVAHARARANATICGSAVSEVAPSSAPCARSAALKRLRALFPIPQDALKQRPLRSSRVAAPERRAHTSRQPRRTRFDPGFSLL